MLQMYTFEITAISLREQWFNSKFQDVLQDINNHFEHAEW